MDIVFKIITNDIDQPDHPVNDPEIIHIIDEDSDEDDAARKLYILLRGI